MNTNRHDETNHGSVTPADLSHPDIEDGKWAETLLAGENRLLEMLATGTNAVTKFLMPCADFIEDFRQRISLWNRAGLDRISNRL